MTVANTPRSAGPYSGNGATSVFTFAFKVFLATDVLVQFVSSSGALTIGTLGTDYAVSLNANQDNTPGGSVITTVPVASGATLTIGSQVPLNQGVDLTNPGGFYPEVVTSALDKLTILIQQALSTISGALRIPEIGSSAQILPPAAQRANQVLAFDNQGNPITVIPVNGSAASLALSLASSASAAQGAGMSGYSQANAYAGGTVGQRLTQDVSVLDLKFMTLSQIVDVVSYAGALDVTACIQAALTYVANTTWTGTGPGAYAKGGGKVYLPPGKWQITDTVNIGANTELYGASAFGSTAPSISTQTGTIIKCNFGATQKKWAISSATYETATGNYAAFNAIYTGTQHDAGAITLTFGIKLHDLTIDCNGAYGGVRLLASSGFDVQNVMVYNVGCGFHFNTCYGARFGNLRSLASLYGCVITNSTAFDAGHIYCDKVGTTWSNVAGDVTTRLVSTFDMSTSAFLPADWSNLAYGLYCSGSIALSFLGAPVCEHFDIGVAFAHVSTFRLSGYFEGNTTSDLTFVSSSGVATAFANQTTGGTKYHFGVNNDIDMQCCSYGSLYVGNVQNKIRVAGSDVAGLGATDWTWNDAITFVDLNGVLRASAAGTLSAVFGYTTFDEAMRRISVSKRTDWTVLIKDGDTVPTASQLSIANKRISIQRETGSTKPEISVGAAGGGFIFRWSLSGLCALQLENVDVVFPTALVGATGDQALVNASEALTLDLAVNNSSVNLGNAYSLLGTFAGGAMNLRAAWSGSGITSTVPAPILRNSGAAVVTSIQVGTGCDANIKALGTNGYQGTVLNSNF